ncbi:MAG: DNA polymerase III subunit gamma/tau [Filomicrobium sp.]
MFDDAEMGAKPYVVLARKYRPQTFVDLIGQDAMVETLKNAFEQGRIAQGYMLTGVRGVGKTTTARILARALNFEPQTGDTGQPTIDLPSNAEDFGRHCAEIMASRHADVIEMDAASNTGVDNVREIIESARYRPMMARYKVFIIDEVHMLSKGAFNALLKTLEEPPEHVKFIFATTEIRKVPVTVLSRCQRFDLRRVDVGLLTQHFQRIVSEEGAQAEDEALMMIARAAEGSVRDGLSILDQAIAFSKGQVVSDDVRTMLGLADRGRVFDLLNLLIGGKPAEALKAFEALHRDGADPVQTLGDLAEAVHLSTRIKTVGAEDGSEGLSAEDVRQAGEIATRVSLSLLSRVWQMLLKGIEETGRAPNPLAAAEMVLIRIAHLADLPAPEEIIKSLGGQPLPARKGKGSTATSAGEKAPTAEATGALDQDPTQPAVPDGRQKPSSAPSAPSASPVESGPATEETPPWADGLDDYGAVPEDADFDPEDPLYADAPVMSGSGLMPEPRSFGDVIELVSAKLDAKLKVHLEENVSLVKFDADAHAIDLYLMPNGPAQLANELREKLNKWTSKKWMVVLSKSPGEKPVGVARREAAAAELEHLKGEPLIAAALEVFPDAQVTDVRDVTTSADKDSANEATDDTVDGTGTG